MNSVFEHFILPISPILALIVTACLQIGVECLGGRSKERLQYGIAILGVIGAMLCTFSLWRQTGHFVGAVTTLPVWIQEFLRAYQIDRTVLCLYISILLFLLLSLVQLRNWFRNSDLFAEVLILTLFVASGMMLLVSSGSLLMLFLSLELMSLPTYVLVGIQRHDSGSCEAALKYFLFGSFATVLLTFGIALLYAQFGTLEIAKIGTVLQSQTPSTGLSHFLVLSSLALLIVATGFKVGMAPFHMWIPDAYQGAATPVTAFMGSGVKLAGFILMMKVLWGIFLPISAHWAPIVTALAVVTMFVGNLAALTQQDVKRLFAYSSISHAGYLLLALGSVTDDGINPTLLNYYLLTYGLMFIGFFATIALIEQKTKSLDISRLAGFGLTHPFLGFAVAVFVLSAAGIPPTAGFLAKYFIFLEAVRAGNTFFVVLAVVSSAIGAYYYLRILVYLYLHDSKETWQISFRENAAVFATILFCVLTVFYFAYSPEPTLQFPMGAR